jgi:hypothetical protein
MSSAMAIEIHLEADERDCLLGFLHKNSDAYARLAEAKCMEGAQDAPLPLYVMQCDEKDAPLVLEIAERYCPSTANRIQEAIQRFREVDRTRRLPSMPPDTGVPGFDPVVWGEIAGRMDQLIATPGQVEIVLAARWFHELKNHIPEESIAHFALKAAIVRHKKARNPLARYIVECNEDQGEELLQIARRVCPAAIDEIRLALQSARQK